MLCVVFLSLFTILLRLTWRASEVGAWNDRKYIAKKNRNKFGRRLWNMSVGDSFWWTIYSIAATYAVAAPGRQGSQVISRSENPQARSPDALFSQKSWRPFFRSPQNTQHRPLTPLIVSLSKCQMKQIKRSDMVTIFIFCSHYYRSKAIGRAEPGRWNFQPGHLTWCSAATAHPLGCCWCWQGRSKGGRAAMTPNRRLSGFFNEKNWLCLDVWPALFSKVTLFSLPEVFCGPQIRQKYGPRCSGSSRVLRATTKKEKRKGRQLFWEKVHPGSSVPM